MLEPFYPDYYVSSAYVIPYRQLYEKGIRGVIFDVDNTLAFHNAPADSRARELFARLHDLGMGTCLLSNNKEPRVRAFAGEVDSLYVFKGGKPGIRGYQASMEKMGTDPRHTVAVGDQLFTDIWGANRAGIYSVLVTPMNPKEEIQIVLKRVLERPILRAYSRKHPQEPFGGGSKEKGKVRE